MSIMSFAAIALYGAAIVAALSAARRSWLFARPPHDTKLWLAIAAVLFALVIFRLGNGEDLLRQNVRAWARASDLYAARRDWQAPFATAVLLIGAMAGFLVWRRWQKTRVDKGQWALRIALLAIAAFLPLYALRLISLHITDALLYSGPVRLNWILELGICGAVLVCAIFYGERVKRRPAGRAPPGRR